MGGRGGNRSISWTTGACFSGGSAEATWLLEIKQKSGKQHLVRKVVFLQMEALIKKLTGANCKVAGSSRSLCD